MAEPRDISVHTLAGETVGRFHCQVGSTVKDLKCQVAAATGVPRFQQTLVCGLNPELEGSDLVGSLQGDVTYVRKALISSMEECQTAPQALTPRCSRR